LAYPLHLYLPFGCTCFRILQTPSASQWTRQSCPTRVTTAQKLGVGLMHKLYAAQGTFSRAAGPDYRTMLLISNDLVPDPLRPDVSHDFLSRQLPLTLHLADHCPCGFFSWVPPSISSCLAEISLSGPI
jgi:hypothetical protein